jgi:hypothetical protein
MSLAGTSSGMVAIAGFAAAAACAALNCTADSSASTNAHLLPDRIPLSHWSNVQSQLTHDSRLDFRDECLQVLQLGRELALRRLLALFTLGSHEL